MSDHDDSAGRGFILPTGIVSFLLSDIAGSTTAWEHAGSEMASAVARHYEIIDEVVARHHGVRPVEQGEGDSVVAAFSRATDAVAAALDAQSALAGEPWPGSLTLRVRVAVHTGEAQLRNEGNYFGPAIIRAARIRDVGHGGQVLVSDATAGLVVESLPTDATLVDLGSVRLKDLGRPERIWQLSHPDLAADFPPVRGLESYANNLPAQLSPLIGRSGAIDELARLVDRERLVTLTGSGGVGKTRLALAVAAELVDRFPGGVWFVELAPTGGADTAARATLRAIEVDETPGLPPTRQVAFELGTRGRALVVLDNCEHTLDDAAGFVAELLAVDADATVLATSRERLDVPGEVAWRVPSLPVPEAIGTVQVETLPQFDAVNLFIDRARRARPSFRVDDANAAGVAQICARLDGIPLAIELAAARCRHLAVDRILAGLDDRFGLLSDGSRVVMPRHQTLAASVAWSHDLLDPDEQRALRRIGVFAGRFELSAAERIVSAFGDIDPVSVFDLVARLVDKNLVVLVEGADAEAGAGGEFRYRLLETIRAFALQRATDAAEVGELRDLHARWWTEQLVEHDVHGPTDHAVSYVETNLDDILAALRWTSETDVAQGLDMLDRVSQALHGAGRAGEAIPAMQRLLDPSVRVDQPERWMRAAVPSSILMLNYLGPQVFIDLLGHAEEIAAASGDDLRLAVIRWVGDMNIDTGAALLAAATSSEDPSAPYLVAVGTVRLATDVALQAPERAAAALAASNQIASSYPSTYINDCADANKGLNALVFGDLALAIECGVRLLDARSVGMRGNGVAITLFAGLLAADLDAVSHVVAAATRESARGTPVADDARKIAEEFAALITSTSAGGVTSSEVTRFAHDQGYFQLLAGRIALNATDADSARAIADSVVERSGAFEIAGLITRGLLDDDEDTWHEALRLASIGGYRPMVVDALEGLATVAARADSSSEALHLLAAADRIRAETGYRYRFPFEQRRIDSATSRARTDLGDDAADTAWNEGSDLDLAAVVEYARRARGERKRPRHGWDSLTPTELRVVDAVADGMTNPEIADRLLMSRSTVKTHLEHVYTKTGIRNRSQLAAEATRRANGTA